MRAENIDQAHAVLLEELDGFIVPFDAKRVKSLLDSTLTEKQCKSFLDSPSTNSIIVKKRWALTSAPSAERVLYQPIQKIVEAVLSHFKLSDSRQVYDTSRGRGIPSDTVEALKSSPDLFISANGEHFRVPPPGKAMHWYHCLTTIEVKKEGHAQSLNEMIAQTAYYARAQPTRSFVYSLLMTQKRVRLLCFDRVGAQYSKWANFRQDPSQLIRMIHFVCNANLHSLGIDKYVVFKDDKLQFTMRRDGKPYILTAEPIPRFIPTGLRGRATTCWTATGPEGESYIIKQQFVDKCRPPEHMILEELVNLQGVDLSTVGVCIFAQVYGWVSTTRGMHTAPETFHDRLLYRIVLSEYGNSIEHLDGKTRLDVLIAIRDAIVGHQALWNNGILHRDISTNNILYRKKNNDDALHRGVLIDFDMATRITGNPNYDIKADCRIGTRAFQSVSVLRSYETEVTPTCEPVPPSLHDYMDDLEAFFWVLFWITRENVAPGETAPLRPRLKVQALFEGPANQASDRKQNILFDCELYIALQPGWGPSFLQLIRKLGPFFYSAYDKRRLDRYRNNKAKTPQQLIDDSVEDYKTVIGHFDSAILSVRKEMDEEAACQAISDNQPVQYPTASHEPLNRDISDSRPKVPAPSFQAHTSSKRLRDTEAEPEQAVTNGSPDEDNRPDTPKPPPTKRTRTRSATAPMDRSTRSQRDQVVVVVPRSVTFSQDNSVTLIPSRNSDRPQTPPKPAQEFTVVNPVSTPSRVSYSALSMGAENIDQAHAVLLEELDGFIVPFDAKRVKSLLDSTLTERQCKSFLDSPSTNSIIVKKRWALTSAPSAERVLYQPIQKIVEAVLSHFKLSDSRQVYDTSRGRGIPSDTVEALKSSPDIFISATGEHFRVPPPGKTMHWYHCLTTIEVKKDNHGQSLNEMIAQTAYYARQTLSAQPTRSFVYSLLMTQKRVRLLCFDRVGAQYSEWANFRQDPSQLIRMIHFVCNANLHSLGIDKSVVFKDDKLQFTMRRDGKPYILTAEPTPRFIPMGLRGRATTCWNAKGPEGESYVIKQQFVNKCRTPEHEILEELMRLPGTDLSTVGVCEFAQVYGWVSTARGMGEVPEDFHDRFMYRIVLKEYGTPIDDLRDKTRLDVLVAIRDAILGHQILWRAGILHRDISNNNVLYRKKEESDTSYRGVLIDFDMSTVINRKDSNHKADFRTGTRMFQSISVLRSYITVTADGKPIPTVLHDHLDDLESFFWVLFWVTRENVAPGETASLLPMLQVRTKFEATADVASDRKYHILLDCGAADFIELQPGWGASFLELIKKLGQFFASAYATKRASKVPKTPQELTADSVADYETVIGYFDSAILSVEKEIEKEEAALQAVVSDQQPVQSCTASDETQDHDKVPAPNLQPRLLARTSSKRLRDIEVEAEQTVTNGSPDEDNRPGTPKPPPTKRARTRSATASTDRSTRSQSKQKAKGRSGQDAVNAEENLQEAGPSRGRRSSRNLGKTSTGTGSKTSASRSSKRK
ncbi:hypothetical protein CVT24_002927 [Panaeolus cyanescens]|uniref:Protein kinase domain-containing protein n=1 Tax=Panaeolus cyanescens TaxID=181874 RepID=A0A409VP60_9AGAR|nr:hypothetical protein CVT24_002927 [Panaeolus cyanescens]